MNKRKTFIIGEPSVPYDWEKDTAVYWPNRKRAEYEDAYWEPMGTAAYEPHDRYGEVRAISRPERSCANGRRRKRSRRRSPILLTLPLFLVAGVLAAFFLTSHFGGTSAPGLPPSGQMPVVDALPQPTDGTEDGAGQISSPQTDDSDTPWNLLLVNKWNALPENYQIELAEVPGGEKVDARIYEPLMDMLRDAEAEGLGPIVASGYRTKEKQQQLYDEKIAKYQGQGYSQEGAKELAEQWVAVPGYSEHQAGLAVDINGDFYDIYLWLQENSYKYGFIFRYPGNKTELTGTAEEVWHYRYVGLEVAEAIHEQGICLEEYLSNN